MNFRDAAVYFGLGFAVGAAMTGLIIWIMIVGAQLRALT